ncbi:TlpA family protein disulfide reductase [Flavivirga spongiicola]|uniref:TlpA family protein disulfide reductase n=1 Tax=Flavivirga spongiicola TaxID=421621 RepID=A0ABU7XQU8_9FLAO|nr:TlpA disulfide reductase family protein [Flavivirga sp. MEBiC05379]MDO5977818.1 TlpA disulfide reductase family protein [Flavivirga sp. MEBiC05379]
MKKLIGLALIILSFYSCNKSQEQPQEQKITIKGHVKFPDANDKFGITLNKIKDTDEFKNEYEIVKEIKLDSNNNYSFDLEVENPEFYRLDVYKQQRVEFYADDEDLEINFRGIDTAKIKIKNPPHVHIAGGEKNNALNALHWARYQNYQYMIAVGQQQYRASLSDSKAWQEDAAKGWDVMHDVYERDIKNIIAMYSDYPTVVKAIQSLSWKRHQNYMVEQYEALAEKFPNVAYIQNAKADLLEKIEDSNKTKIGAVAPDFTFPDMDGNEVSLNSFKGKYVLIDFWASWCGPCRKESPNVQKQYQLYKDKGFEVVSVSIDKKEDAWRKAVKEDNLKGTLLLAKDSKKIMKDYVFSGIPYMVLLDKEGKVMALNLRGEALQEKLKEVFN